MIKGRFAVVLTEDKVLVGEGEFNPSTLVLILNSYAIATRDGHWKARADSVVLHLSQVKRLAIGQAIPNAAHPDQLFAHITSVGCLV